MNLWSRTQTAGSLAQHWLSAEGPAAELPAMCAAIAAALAASQASPLLARAVVPAGVDAPRVLAGAQLAVLRPYHLDGTTAAVAVHAVQGGIVERPFGGLTRWRTAGGDAVAAVAAAPAADPAGYAAAIDRIAALLGPDGGWPAVARTWWWLKRILEHYAGFNQARSARFAAHGLIAPDGTRRLPASTGIGLAPADGTAVVEALAFPGQAPQPLERTARQHAASGYGSSFARAVRVASPTGGILLISGTAAIDSQGRTVGLGDRTFQVRETIACLRAVLAEAGIDEERIVSGMAYALDDEAAGAWRAAMPASWPVPTVPAVICRPDLLVECELAALL